MGTGNQRPRESRAVILEEHRALAAVLHGLRFLVRRVREGGRKPDFPVLRAMLHYIDTFPEKEHHPREDRYLFSRVRLRTHEVDAALDDLEAEHVRGAEMIRHLEQGLLRFEQGGGEYLEPFATAVEAYCDFHWQHMRKEEDVILPAAERVLTDADWAELNAAFAGKANPLGGVQAHQDFDQLFREIVKLAPPPIGVGPE